MKKIRVFCEMDCQSSWEYVIRTEQGLTICEGLTKPYAEFIVKSVNCHDELVKALKEYLTWITNRKEYKLQTQWDITCQAEQALKKAS